MDNNNITLSVVMPGCRFYVSLLVTQLVCDHLNRNYIDYILYSAGYQQKQTIKKPHGQLKSQPQGNYSYIQIRDMIKRSSA